MADSLGLLTKGTAAVMRQLIRGKLTEMGQDPQSVQVVVQGTNENVLFLINEEGIIRTIKPARDHVAHVSQSVDAGTIQDGGSAELRSALHGSEGELKRRPEVQSVELQRVQTANHVA